MTAGYVTVVLANKNVGTVVGSGLAVSAGSVLVFLGDEVTTTASVESGLKFSFIPNPNITETIKTTITVYGNERWFTNYPCNDYIC